MNRILAGLAIATLFAGPALGQGKTRLEVYSTLEAENIADFKKAFEAANKDIEIVWNRDSTGVLTARILAEQGNQRADAIWGLAVTSMMLLKERGILEPYAPPTLGDLKPAFRDADPVPSWVGMEAWVAAVCFNTVEARRLGLAKPVSWFDLTDVRYRGKFTMPHPASSGTGFFHVSAWLQMFGETRAWEFMDRLHENVATYEHSGTRPCRLAASGEYPLGISYELAVASARQKGAPIEGLMMKEGGGWDMDAAGILRGTKHPQQVRRLMDFAASRQANELYASFVSQVAMPGIKTNIAEYPVGVAESMIGNDFAWASKNRSRILAEWAKRYDGKAAKKN